MSATIAKSPTLIYLFVLKDISDVLFYIVDFGEKD